MRFGRLAIPVINDRPDYKFELGKGITLKEGKDVTIIATGLCVGESLEAAKLLATTEKKITVISGETGFENMDYFCKTFKKYYGRTPTEYRRKKQMDTDDREGIVQDVV